MSSPPRRHYLKVLTAFGLALTSLAGAYQIVGDVSGTATTWSGTIGTYQTTSANYVGGTASATFRSALTTTVTASRDVTNNQNSVYVGDASGGTTTLKDPMSTRGGANYTAFSPAFTPANVEGLYVVVNSLKQDGSFVTKTVTSGTNSQTVREKDDPACYGATGTVGSAGSCLRGFLTVNFSRPVTNPILHLTGVGGNARRTNDFWGVATRLRLLTSGVTINPVGTPSNLAVTTVSGTPSIGVLNFGSGTLIAAGTGTPVLNTYDVIQGTCTPATGTTSAGCGSFRFTGTFSQLQFEVRLETRKVVADSSAAAYPYAVYSGPNGSTTDSGPSADAINVAVSIDEDFGDAPAGYDATAAASHVVGDLKLGSAIDADNTGTLNGSTAVTPSPNAVAAGADNTGTNGDGADEDAITSFPALSTANTSYSLTVPISGASQAGQVCGWIDFDRGGLFGNVATERACAAFAAGASSVTLTWSGLSGLTAGQNYVRLRASYDTAGVQNPTGRLDSGEVEDYRLNITLPADLSITKTDGVTTVAVSGATTYTVRVTNNGPGSVTGAVLNDPAASGLSKGAVSCSSAAGNTCVTAPTATQLESAGGVTLPTLASGAFYEIVVPAAVTACR